MSTIENAFPGFILVSPEHTLLAGANYETLAKVEPDLWEVKRAFHNGKEAVAVYHRGDLFHHQYNYEQSGVKTMPISAIIHAQAYVITAGGDVQTIRNDVEALNVLARKVISQLDLQDQGRAQEWAKKEFNDPITAADEFYHTCMGFMMDNLRKWKHKDGMVITQRMLWGIQSTGFTISMKHEDDKIEFNRKYEFLSDFTGSMQEELKAFTELLLTMGWISASPDPIDIERLRKERIARNFVNHHHNVEQSLKHKTLTSECRTAESFANLPPAMREEAMEAARNVNVEDAYPSIPEQERLQLRRNILGRIAELEAAPADTESEKTLRDAAIRELNDALTRV